MPTTMRRRFSTRSWASVHSLAERCSGANRLEWPRVTTRKEHALMSLCLAARWAVLAVAVGTATLAGAQDAAGPPPAPSSGGGLYVHELLPDIGLIGAEVGLVAGACVNPYDAGHGICGGGFIALPLRRAAGGKVSYEMALNVGTGRSDPFMITDPFAYVANLAAGASATAAAAGPPQAPFPVHRLVRTRLRMLQVSPFGLRYMPKGRSARVRPYLAA